MTAETLVNLFAHYGYLIVFLVSVWEGPIISITSGFLISMKVFNPIVVFFILVLGDMAGDTFYFMLGFYGRDLFLNKLGKYIGATPEKVETIKKHFSKHDWKLLLFGKTQAWGSLLLVMAGIYKMNYGRFIYYNTIGTIPKVILFLAAGYYLGQTYSHISVNKYFDYFSILWFIFSILLLIGYFYARKYFTKRFLNEDK